MLQVGLVLTSEKRRAVGVKEGILDHRNSETNNQKPDILEGQGASQRRWALMEHS